jgi:hypothetical protein
VLAVARRFFVFDEETVAAVQPDAVAQSAPDPVALSGEPARTVAAIPESPDDTAVDVSQRDVPGAEAVGQAGGVPDASDADDEDGGEAPRLAFSPAFLCAVCTLIMAPLLGIKSLWFFGGPLVLFVLISRRGDSARRTFERFFRSDDLGPPVTGDPGDVSALAQAEADQFAKEAETGRHGGMGLGDAKLAIGLGAVLGPGLAMLSLGFATLLGAVTGVTLAARHGRSLRIGLPFVPFMAVGAILSMLYGPAVVQWYSGFLYPEPVRPPTPAEIRRDEKARERLEKGIAEQFPAAPAGEGSKESDSIPSPR